MRSLLVAAALVALAAGGYAGARESSLFAVRTVEVVGGPPGLREKVRAALEPQLGRSLVAVDADDVARVVAPLPEVRSVSVDRAFPHTLRVVVARERPVLVLRRGADGWAVSAQGRVIRKLRNVKRSSLPRVWVPKETAVRVGAVLPAETGASAAAAVGLLSPHAFPDRVRSVRVRDAELTLVLGSGLEVRLGDAGDLRLKLAISRRIVAMLGDDPDETYVDVSVPERPVAGTTSLESQVEVDG